MKKIFFLVAITLSACSHADIWKVKKPNGTYEYGNGAAMPPGAIKIDVERNAPNVIQPLSTPSMIQTTKAQNDNLKFDDSYNRLKELEKKLEAAKKAVAEGEEPLPGERVGNYKGGSRLREEYFERNNQLQENVKNAQKEYEQALTQIGKDKQK